VATTYGVDDYPLSIVAGDFNGDGALDLATASDEKNVVTVLLNRCAR
jgi:hypothetical protein